MDRVYKFISTTFDAIVQELTKRRCGRIFGYSHFIAILNEGTTEPFPT